MRKPSPAMKLVRSLRDPLRRLYQMAADGDTALQAVRPEELEEVRNLAALVGQHVEDWQGRQYAAAQPATKAASHPIERP